MARRRSSSGPTDIWPGFVDVLSTLLLVIIFLLVVFVLAQVVLSQAITGKDEALDRLNRQVNELTQLLDLEQQANAELRLNIAQLSQSLQESVAARDALSGSLAEAQARAANAEASLAALQDKAGDKDDQIERRLAEIESLRRDVAALRQMRDQLEARVSELAASVKQRDDALAAREDELKATQQEVGNLRDRSKELEAKLADEQERTVLAQREVEEREIRLTELLQNYNKLQEENEAERKLTEEQRATVALLNQQVLALRQEIQKLNEALDAADAKDKAAQATIVDLGKKLNRALAAKVSELQKYRSEFFGRLREILGNRPGIQIVGDRFVFQSEVLFASASADLGPDGQEQMRQLADTLLTIARDIPPEVEWVLRVDGHTDALPIRTPQFPSNWELSAARAISVVKFLIAQGVPPKRLAATGFGQYQPIDPATDEIGNRRNRRIELKLTER